MSEEKYQCECECGEPLRTPREFATRRCEICRLIGRPSVLE